LPITHDFVTIHNCDSTEGIVVVGDGAISVNTSIYKEGTGALNVYKPYTSTNSFGIELSFSTPINFRGKLLAFWLYAKKGVISKLDKIRITYVDSSNRIGYRDISPDILNEDGWKSILYLMNYRWQSGWYLKDPPFGDLNGYSPSYPSDDSISKIRIEFFTKSASDTVSEGELIIDWIRYGKSIIVLEGIVGNLFTKIAEYDRQNNLGLIDYGDGAIVFKGVTIVVGDGVTSYIASSHGEGVIYITPSEGDTFIYVRRYSKVVIGRQVSGKVGKDGSSFHAYGYPYYLYLIRGESATDSTVEIWQSSMNFFNVMPTPFNGIFINNLTSKVYNSSFLNAYFSIFRCNYDVYNVQFLNNIYGIQGGTAISIEGLFANGGEAPVAFEYAQKVTVYGFVSRNTTYLARLVSFYGDCTLADVDTDTLSRNWAGTASYNTGILRLAYTFSPRILDQQGNPLAGALVRLTDRFGNVVYEDTTNVDGRCPPKLITVIVWKGKGQTGVNVDDETNYNPFNIEIYKDGYLIYKSKIIINRKYDLDVNVAYAISSKAFVSKAYYEAGEHVIVHAEFLDSSGLRIKGLTVSAVVIKPDGTEVTIALRDDGVYPDEVANDGIYSGLFAETDLAGTYEVKVFTTINEVQVEAKVRFDVGRLEGKIDELGKTLEGKLDSIAGSTSRLEDSAKRTEEKLEELARSVANLLAPVLAIQTIVLAIYNLIEAQKD